MVTEFRLPELGENVESGDVIKLLVSVGDTIAPDQPVLELETDKATIEVPASVGGVVKEIKVKPGEKVQVGQVILTVEEDGQRRVAEAEARPASQERVEPKMAESREAEEALEAATGVELKPEEQEEAEARQEERAARIEAQREEAVVEKEEPARREEAALKPRRAEVVEFSRAPQAPPAPPAPPAPETPREAAPAAPSVRRLARELGIDINQVPGSGIGGRISAEDVKNYARWLISKAREVRPAPARPTTVAAAPLPDFALWGEIERMPMSNIRRKTAQHLTYAWTTIPHVTQYDKADITELEQLRQRFGKKAEAAGGKLTMTAVLLKVATSGLKVFPQFNASLDMEREEIIYKKYYHIGVAVDTDRGLLVPVIRDVDKKNMVELSAEVAAAAERARNKKTTLDELQGGTFTITNLGGIGGTYFSPIVNAPEVAILGVSRSSMEPVYVNGQFEPRLVLPLSLSYDHRLIDGADAARFLRWVVEALEQPFLLTLEG
ncbi:MAG: 2-oxo acid dehydrogenase subunit E2 [Acidobacteria bacterium]|nr:2-oxo acid dehydrogenase subunit E2 [Acidobacteriota bacterium]